MFGGLPLVQVSLQIPCPMWKLVPNEHLIMGGVCRACDVRDKSRTRLFTFLDAG